MGPTWVGKTIGNRYQIEALLGRGGMSAVYRAFDPNLKRKVALKIIHAHLTDNPEFIQRFEQEASLVAQLRHPNIIQIHDFNQDNGAYYMVMDYIAGETLAARLDSLNNAGIRMPLADTVRIMALIGDAVDFAHQQRMIHRDLKPANVVLDLLGKPYLTDFGIAKLVGASIHTATGAALGTAAYMAPEHVRGDEIDHRADIYSLGIMLYELLSGSPPFNGNSTYQILIQQVQEPLPDIQNIELNTPSSLVAILNKALAKLPAERYQSAAEMVVALRTVEMQLSGPTDILANRHQERLNLLWQQARTAFDERRYGECIDRLDELKRADEDYQHGRVRQMRLEALEKWHEQAEREYIAGHMDLCLRLIHNIRDRDPNYPINELEYKARIGLQQLHLQAQLDALYASAIAHVEKREFTEALAKWNAIQLQKETLPYPDQMMVEQRAREGLCANQYNQALAALAANQPEEAVRHWQQLLTINPLYPDSQQVTTRANDLISQNQRRQEQANRRRRLFWFTAALLIIGIVVVGLLLRQTATATAVATPTTIPAALLSQTDETATPTTTATTAATATATAVTTTNSPTATTTPPPASPTAPSNNPTAVINANASIFARPDSASTELAILRPAEEIRILARSDSGNWLFIMNEEGVQGFVIGERVTWDGDRNELPIRRAAPLVIVTLPAANTPTTASGSVTLTLYPLPGTGTCNGQAWQQMVFIEGQGGGPFTYYWNNQLIAQNVTGSTSFSVSSEGAPVIGMGRVVNASGASASRELFLNKPACDE
jgi:serine/threonine protein kinase